MSELLEPPKPKPSKLKQLTSAEKWVSPFRSSSTPGARKNIHQELKDKNNIATILVPKKFASHPTLEKKARTEAKAAEAKVAEAKAEAKDETKDAEDETKAAEDETKDAAEDETKDEAADAEAEAEAEAEEEVEEAEEAPLEPEATAETVLEDTPVQPEAEEEVEEEAPEEAEEVAEESEPEAKPEPVKIPDFPKQIPIEERDDLKDIRDRPILLEKYNALSAQAENSKSKTLDDPNRVIDLGLGLKMTQAQLLAIAASRVAPVLSTIDNEVSKTREEDEIKRQEVLAGKVASHEKKLDGEFQKHLKKLGKKKDKFNNEIDAKINDLRRLQTSSKNAAAEFEKTTKQEIATAHTDYEARESLAVEKHTTDKETLIKNAEELLATKKQELEDSKSNQEKTTQEIEENQTKKSALDDENTELSSKIEQLTAELAEETSKLDDLTSRHTEKVGLIEANETKKADLNDQLEKAKSTLTSNTAKHVALTASVGALVGSVATYKTRLDQLKSEKEQVPDRLATAKDQYNSWESEKQATAAAVLLDQERQRAADKEEEETKRLKAVEEAETARVIEENKRKQIEEELETKRIQEELEAKQEAEKQKKLEEEARIAAEKAAEEKAEADRIAAEEKVEADRIEAERIAALPETQRQLRITKRKEEQERLRAIMQTKEDEYFERKAKEEEEAQKLLEDIEDLKNQKEQRALDARADAEKLAAAKLDEIEKLKLEHEERLKFYEERLAFEELQRSRLLLEVENLKKIRLLREEKEKLALEVNDDPKLDAIQKLINARELEAASLSKQIELDDADLYRSRKNKESDFHSEPQFSPVEAKSSGDSPVLGLKQKESELKPEISKGAIAGAVGAGIAGVATAAVALNGNGNGTTSVAAPTPSVTKNVSSTPPSEEAFRSRLRSLSQSVKKLTKKLIVKKEPVVANDTAKVDSIKPSKTESTKKESLAVPVVDSSINGSYESLVQYEEVSDSEWEQNQGNPDYVEISQEEYDRAQAELAAYKK